MHIEGGIPLEIPLDFVLLTQPFEPSISANCWSTSLSSYLNCTSSVCLWEYYGRLCWTPYWGKSNARCSPFFTQPAISWQKAVRMVQHKLLFVNLISFLPFICVEMKSRRICSTSFPVTKVRLTGPWFPRSSCHRSDVCFLTVIRNMPKSTKNVKDNKERPCSDISSHSTVGCSPSVPTPLQKKEDPSLNSVNKLSPNILSANACQRIQLKCCFLCV